MSEITERVFKWLEGRPVWTSHAIFDIVSGNEIDDQKISEYSELCIQENNGSFPAKKEIQSELLGGENKAISFSMTILEEMKNINAIDSEAKLSFANQGLSVVYGNNGSGKSGYVRALKKACGLSYSEIIRSNVFSKRREEKQTCKITISKADGSAEEVFCYLNEKSPESLSGIEIFDTQISQAYIGDTKEASYEPWIFSVLASLAQIADRIKSRLQFMSDQVEIIFPTTPAEIENEQIILSMKSINAQSKFDSFDIIWTESEEYSLQSLEKIINDKSPQTSIDIAHSRLINLESFSNYVVAMESYLSPTHLSDINSKQIELKHLLVEKKDVEFLFSLESDSIDANSVKLNSWKKLWQYARQYATEISQSETDIPTNVCPLCHQSLREDILKRYQTIDIFINSQVNKAIEDQSTQFKKIIALNFKPLSTSEHELLLNNCGFEKEKKDSLIKLLDDAVQLINNTSNKAVDLASIEVSVEAIDLTQLSSAICAAEKVETERLEQHTLALKSEEREKMLSERIFAQAKKYISMNKESIKKIIDKNMLRENYNRSMSLTVTNAITKLSNSLADELLTKEYETRFNDELLRLTSGSIKVKLIKAKGGKGKVPFKIVVVNQNDEEFKPNDILSEGERRVVSLAAFLADTSNGQISAPLIFDDPISSLDYEYEAKAIDRLVQIAGTRQVIVFTHRISMVYGLSEQCNKMGIDFFEMSIQSVLDRKGVPGTGILEKSKVKGRIRFLVNNRLPELKRIEFNSDTYLTFQSGLCADFRNIVEKSIEDILLCGIAQRYDRIIHSTHVMRLSKITIDDCTIVDRMMTKYSAYDHSQPDETPCLAIDYNELYKDFLEVQKWIEEAQSRIFC